MQRGIKHHARKARMKENAYSALLNVWEIFASYIFIIFPIIAALLAGLLEKYIF